ncbi:hypothetical protein FRB96_000289 [Tulasnella sp. 330]|nr:hypothetical protein FRB96_000289 [Tulasnella sp. 330]KAG8882266.1 hypothetical protein FRB97_008469 [Tulasnella sp. 331]
MSQPECQAGEDSNIENNLITMTALDISIEALRRKNQRLAVNSLPEHILLNIIFLILLEANNKYYKALCILSQVSAGWALLIRESPSLWGLIDFNHPAQIQHIALSRSKESLINIIDSLSDKQGGNDPLIARLIPQSHRWRSVKYYGFPSRCWLDSLNDVQVPALKYLDIHLAVCPRMLDLFQGEAPSLKHLRLWGCSINWRSDMLSGLHTLHLNGVYPTCPSVDDLINVLRASPTLVNFDLSHFKCEAPSDDSALRAKPVDLPHLVTYKLYDLPLLATQALLRVVRIPACTQLTLDVRTRTPSDLFDASMDHAAAVMNNILASKNDRSRTSFHVTQETIFIQRWQEDTRRLELEVTVRGAMDFNLMERLVKIFESPQVVDLDKLIINSMLGDLSLSLLQPIFCSSLRSRCLSIKGWSSMEEVLRYIGEPIIVEGTTRWPLPTLQTIKLVRARPRVNVLLDIFKRRYGADPDSHSVSVGLPSSVERPAALETLAINTPFDNADAAEVDQLKRMLGNGVLEWESSKG